MLASTRAAGELLRVDREGPFLGKNHLHNGAPFSRRGTTTILLDQAVEAAEHDDEMVWKTGATGGYSTYIGFSTKTRSATLALSNAGYNANDDIGMHLANPDFPLNQYPPMVAVDPAILASYAGTYAASPKSSLTIRASGARLFVRVADQVECELFPDSADHFFMRSADAQAIFHRDADGQVRQLIWHQNYAFQYWRRAP